MSWWEIKDSRAGVTLALVNASSLNRTEARRIGDRISMVLGGVPLAMHLRTARPNPTLVHHGTAQGASFHLLTQAGAPLADLYVGLAAAKKMAHVLADHMGIVLELATNDEAGMYGRLSKAESYRRSPTSGGPVYEVGSGLRLPRLNPKRGGRKNPGPVTLAKERDLTVRLLEQLRFDALADDVRTGRHTAREALRYLLAPSNRLLPESRKMIVRAALGVLEAGQGMTAKELAGLKVRARAAAKRGNPNPGGRKGWVLTHIAKGYGRVFISTRLTTDGRADEMFTTDVAEAKVWRTRGEAAAAVKRAKEVWAFGWKWSVAPATTLNPSRGKGARTHRKAKRKAFGSRRVYRAAAATHRPQTPAARAAALAKFGYRMDSHQARTRRRLYRGPSIPGTSRPYSNPGGRFSVRKLEDVVHSATVGDYTQAVFEVVDGQTGKVVMRSYNQRDARTEAAYRNKHDPRGSFTRTRADHPSRNPSARETSRQVDALLKRARMLFDAGKKTEAQRVYNQAWELAPHHNRRAPIRHRRGRITANPRSEMSRALATARMWSELEPGRVTRVKGPKRVPKVMAKLGELVSVVYRSDKYDGKSKLYEHKTRRPRPVLATDPDGRDVFVVGGDMKVTADGLVN